LSLLGAYGVITNVGDWGWLIGVALADRRGPWRAVVYGADAWPRCACAIGLLRA
jgi:hypothetical protein